jgi:gamma-glutamylaminecyclotransferase
MNFVFVYGTLKQGFPNHHLLPTSRLVGACSTTDRWPLVIGGDWFSPILINDDRSGCEVAGELYSMDDSSLEYLDDLEGVGAPFGFTRIEISVDIMKVPVWTYAKPSELVSKVHEGPLARYVTDPRYVPGEQRGKPNRGFGPTTDRP